MRFTRRMLGAWLAGLPFLRGAKADPGANVGLPTNSARKRYEPPPHFWYENAAGEKWIPGPQDFADGMTNLPEGYKYEWLRYTHVLETCCSHGGGLDWAGESGWPEDLAFAMANDGYRLQDAILIGSRLCERCRNAAAHEYGLKWGYARHSDEWHRAGTQCDYCRDEPRPAARVLVNRDRPRGQNGDTGAV